MGNLNNNSVTNKSSTSIEDLPEECLNLIFQYLTIGDRVRIERVCKLWQHVSKDSLRAIKNFESLCISSKKRRTEGERMSIDYCTLKSIFNRCGKYLHSVNMRRIKFISLKDERHMVSVVIPETCHNLQVLNLSCYTVDVKSFSGIFPLCANLRTILFRITFTEDSEIVIIKFLTKARKLKHFWNKWGTIHLDLFPESMEEIRLECCTIKSFRSESHFNNMHTLFLTSPKYLDDASLETISKMVNLKSLNLTSICEESKITIRGMKHLGKLKKLVKLDVCENERFFTDAVMDKITENCKELVYLDISGNNKLTDEGLVGLTKLTGLRILFMKKLKGKVTGDFLQWMINLEILDCKGCPKIRTKNLCELVKWTVNLKRIDCVGCNTDVKFLEVARNVTAYSLSGTSLYISIDLPIEDIAPFQVTSRNLKIHNSSVIYLERTLEVKYPRDGGFNQNDWSRNVFGINSDAIIIRPFHSF